MLFEVSLVFAQANRFPRNFLYLSVEQRRVSPNCLNFSPVTSQTSAQFEG